MIRPISISIASLLSLSACDVTPVDPARVDAAGTDAASAPDAIASDAGTRTRLRGAVSLYQAAYPDGAGGATYDNSISARFEAPGAGSFCTEQPLGSCVVSVCDYAATLPDAGVVSVDAGAITITGGAVPAASPIVLVPTGGAYLEGASPAYRMRALWAGGEMIRVQAEGSASVPAFDESFETPSATLTVSTPAIDPTMPLAVPRNAPLSLAWSDARTGVVDVSISQSGAGSATTLAECWFGAATGAGTIPADVLGRLSPGMATIIVGAGARVVVPVGEYDVSLVASQQGIGITGTLALE